MHISYITAHWTEFNEHLLLKNWMIVCLLRGEAGNSSSEYIQSGKTQVQILPNANNL